MKGSAPKCSPTGSHSLPAKNLKPNACHDRAERNMSSYTMRPKSPKIESAQTSTTDLKIGSPISWREVRSDVGGAVGVVGTPLSAFFSTGCGPGLLGEFRAASAIYGFTVVEVF